MRSYQNSPMCIVSIRVKILNSDRKKKCSEINTVDGRGKISEPHATGTSKLDWRSLESMQIDRNKVQIRTNWQKGTGTKKPENFRNFENFKEKKCQNSPLCSISDLIIAGQVP